MNRIHSEDEISGMLISDDRAFHSVRYLAALVFLQMLPATMLTPAIRPFFADQHSGQEWAMHAFMAINMAGAAIFVPFIGALTDRISRPRTLFAMLVFFDAILLGGMVLPMPTKLVLALRALEGIVHVSATTILLAEASSLAGDRNRGRTMGMAGAAIVFAIAAGNALGGMVVGLHWRVPFFLAATILMIVAAVSLKTRNSISHGNRSRSESAFRALLTSYREIWFPLGSAFVERFVVGCIVVTFSLYAHKAHGLSDSRIGLLFALLTFPFAISMYPISRLSGKVPRTIILIFGALTYSAVVFLLGQTQSWVLPLLMISAGIGAAMIFAPTLCYASTLVPEDRRASAMALVNAAGCAGMLSGPAVAGITTAIFRNSENAVAGYQTVFTLAAASVIIWLLIGHRWLLKQYRKESTENQAQGFGISLQVQGKS